MSETKCGSSVCFESECKRKGGDVDVRRAA